MKAICNAKKRKVHGNSRWWIMVKSIGNPKVTYKKSISSIWGGGGGYNSFWKAHFSNNFPIQLSSISITSSIFIFLAYFNLVSKYNRNKFSDLYFQISDRNRKYTSFNKAWKTSFKPNLFGMNSKEKNYQHTPSTNLQL